MVASNWVNIRLNTGPCNGLLPDGTKPLPESMLTYDQWGSVTITWGLFHEIHQPWITKIRLAITYLNFNSNRPGANELIDIGFWALSNVTLSLIDLVPTQIDPCDIVDQVIAYRVTPKLISSLVIWYPIFFGRQSI